MKQPSLFNIPAGEAQLEEALTRVAAHTDDAWLEEAKTIIRRVALTHQEFTGADIWQAGLSKPEEPRRLGIVMRYAVVRGWITQTDRTRKSEIPSQHRQPLQVWRSLIFRKESKN